MQPKNKSVTIELDETLIGIVSQLAKKENQSTSRVIAKLMAEALEQREEMYFSKLADEIEINDAELVDHDDVWK